MEHVQAVIEPGKKFAKDSIRLVKKCTKPDRKGSFPIPPPSVMPDLTMAQPYAAEYQKIAFATAIGFAVMGFIGFFVKLIHIPINNIIVGGG